MSWSVDLIGKPENVANALLEESNKLSGQSKVEYDAALPHMVALVRENFAKQEGIAVPTLVFKASGSGYARENEQVQRSVQVKIEHMWGKVV